MNETKALQFKGIVLDFFIKHIIVEKKGLGELQSFQGFLSNFILKKCNIEVKIL